MNERLQAYLDGRLSHAERVEFERQLAAESPALLRAIRAMAEHPQVAHDAEPGPWFTDRVMANLEAEESKGLNRFLHLLLTPQKLHVRPLSALLFAGAVGLSFLTYSNMRPSQAPPQVVLTQRATTVTLRLKAPLARTVNAVGDFNGWSVAATPLVPAGNGEWVARVTLAPGIYQYSFWVDGAEWQTDPQAKETVDDGFGRTNALLKL